MYVSTIKKGDLFLIDEKIVIECIKVQGGYVKISINAPIEVRIVKSKKGETHE